MKRFAMLCLLLAAIPARAEIVDQYVEVAGLRGSVEVGADDFDTSGGQIGASIEMGKIAAIRPYGYWTTADIYGYDFKTTAFGADLVARLSPSDELQFELIAGAASVEAEFAILGLKDTDTGTRGGAAVRYAPADAVELFARALAFSAFDASSNEVSAGIIGRLTDRLWVGVTAFDSEGDRSMTASLRFRM